MVFHYVHVLTESKENVDLITPGIIFISSHQVEGAAICTDGCQSVKISFNRKGLAL
jgi:hypothetical protein